MPISVLQAIHAWKHSYPDSRIPNPTLKRKAALVTLFELARDKFKLSDAELIKIKEVIVDACVPVSLPNPGALMLWRKRVEGDFDMALLDVWPSDLFPKQYDMIENESEKAQDHQEDKTEDGEV